eukprot:scaffold69965_cov48-Attheya_sp.AAC.1
MAHKLVRAAAGSPPAIAPVTYLAYLLTILLYTTYCSTYLLMVVPTGANWRHGKQPLTGTASYVGV